MESKKVYVEEGEHALTRRLVNSEEVRIICAALQHDINHYREYEVNRKAMSLSPSPAIQQAVDLEVKKRVEIILALDGCYE